MRVKALLSVGEPATLKDVVLSNRMMVAKLVQAGNEREWAENLPISELRLEYNLLGL